jgi:hypothetical protein
MGEDNGQSINTAVMYLACCKKLEYLREKENTGSSFQETNEK